MQTHATIQSAVLTFSLLFLATGLGSNSATASDKGDPTHSFALRAFNSEPEFQRELAQLESQGYVRGPVQSISLGGFCGVAGCDSSFLIAVILSRGQNLPKQLLANVTVRSPDFAVVRIRRIQLVEAVHVNDVLKDSAD